MEKDHKISELQEIETERVKTEKKLRYYKDREKILKHQMSQLTRKERTNRLCTRAGMLESFLQRPSELTNDQVMMILKTAFRQKEVNEMLQGMLDEIEKGEGGDADGTSQDSILE